MPYLDDTDPIVRLASAINDQIPDNVKSSTLIAALASLLGASLDMIIDDDDGAPPEFIVLRAMLMHVTSSIVSTRAVLDLRES